MDTVAWPLGGRSLVGDELRGGACGRASCACCRAREGERRGWGGSQAHSERVEPDGVVGDELVRRRRRKGSPAVLGEDEVDAVASRHASARGSCCSTKSTTAKLVDTVSWCGDDGGYGYD